MDTYNKLEVGDRIRLKRSLLGLTQDQLAEKIDRVPKYCADIERGSCGMSVETMLAFASVLNMSLDYLMLGVEEENSSKHQDEVEAILDMLNHCSPKKRQYALQLLKLFLVACDN